MGLITFWSRWFGRSGIGFARSEADYDDLIGDEIEAVFRQWRNGRGLATSQIRAFTPEAILSQLDNRSGYVREFCLRVLAERDLNQALKPVLLRLNDYVEVNRRLATVLSLKWLSEVALDVVVDALPDVAAVAKRSRVDRTALDAAVLRRLDSDAGRDALKRGLSHTHAKVRQCCWRWCAQLCDWTVPQRMEAAMVSGDPAIARSVEPDVMALPDNELLAWFGEIHKLRAMPLRRAVFVAVRRRGLVDSSSVVERAMWDNSFSIRSLVHLWCKQVPQALVQQYLQALNADGATQRKRYALEGLAVLKQANTLADCQQVMHDPDPAVRKAALTALCSLDPDCLPSYVSAAIGDPALSVLRQALRLMVSASCPLPADALQSAARNRCNDLEFFQLILNYANLLPLWPALQLTSFTSLAGPVLQAKLRPEIEIFLRNLRLTEVYAAPTREQWTAIRAWLPGDGPDWHPVLRSVLVYFAPRMEANP